MSIFLRRYAVVILYLMLVLTCVSSWQAGVGKPQSQTAARPEPPLVTDPDLVLLTVSVTGPRNSAAAGLGKDRFRIEEDGVEQQLTYFWEDSRPITVGFVLDNSDRMATNDKITALQDAARSFLITKNPSDEYFIVRMANSADVGTSFTTESRLLPPIFPVVRWSATGLNDAIYIGLHVIKEAANPRKVLLVITGGGDGCTGDPTFQPVCSDNYKRTSDQALTGFALKQPVQIYNIFVAETCPAIDCMQIPEDELEFETRSSILLNDLALMTGGRSYLAQNAAGNVDAYCGEIARGLKTQYIVGYKSTHAAHDGKRRGVRVQVSQSGGSPKMSVWTKSGYYAPKDTR